jgi:hypothetical protein
MSIREIENRLAVLEKEVAQLKAQRRAVAATHPIHTFERIHGTFENDEAFREAMRLGRKWRKSQDAAARKPRAKRS